MTKCGKDNKACGHNKDYFVVCEGKLNVKNGLKQKKNNHCLG